jgi:multicomponent Na+:H+ antiporter subunit D
MYAIIRLYFTVFATASVDSALPVVSGGSPLAFLAPVLLAMGAVSILIGGLGAVSRSRLDGLFAYSSIGQVGFIAVPVAVAAGTTSASLRHLGVLAGLVYALHHALAKGLLFLASGAIRDATGTTELSELGGLGERSTTLAIAFLVGNLSLIGIPPLAGFFGKLLVFEVSATQFANDLSAGTVVTLAVLLVGAVLTIVYATRAWVGSVWGVQTERVETATFDGAQLGLLAVLSVLVVLVGFGFEPVYQFADAATTAAIDAEAYVETVGPGDAS